MQQIAIAIGANSHINLPTIEKLLGRQMSDECFRVERVPGFLSEVYPYQWGAMVAEMLAIFMGFKYQAPLCIGVVAAQWVPNQPGLRPSRLEIASMIERGSPKPPIALTPIATRNAAKPQAYAHWCPNQMHFADEAAQTLAATVKTRHESLHLI